MTKDPVEPTRTVVTLLTGVSAATLILMVVTIVIGYHSTCVEHGAFGQLVDEQVRPGGSAQLADNVSLYTNAARLCVTDPSIGQRLLAAPVIMGEHLLLLATLLLTIGLFRLIGKQGLFSEPAVRRLRLIGWVVLAGGPVVGLLVAFASAALLESMLVRHPFDVLWIDQWEVSFTAIVLGTVLISLARILRVSTAMREDLEGTV